MRIILSILILYLGYIIGYCYASSKYIDRHGVIKHNNRFYCPVCGEEIWKVNSYTKEVEHCCFCGAGLRWRDKNGRSY